MLTQTTETALRALIFIALNESGQIITPREIAPKLNASPTYLAKITRMLVKADILISHRGVNGGVSMNRPPKSITLLEITEACQGLLVGNYCRALSKHVEPVCAFHRAMQEIHDATVKVLNKYTLKDFITNPREFNEKLNYVSQCKMALEFPDKA